MNKRTAKRKTPAPSPGEVWQIFEGPDRTFAGYLVTERGNPHRQIAAVPLTGTPDGRKRDMIKGLRNCRRIARDPSFAKRSSQVVTAGSVFAKLDSDLSMPVEAYSQLIIRDGHDKFTTDENAAHSFPFCRFRIAEMILALPKDTPAAAVIKSIAEAMCLIVENDPARAGRMHADFCSIVELLEAVARTKFTPTAKGGTDASV